MAKRKRPDLKAMMEERAALAARREERKEARRLARWRVPYLGAALLFWVFNTVVLDPYFPGDAAKNTVRAAVYGALALGWGVLALLDRGAGRDQRQVDAYVVVLGLVVAAHSGFRAAFPADDAFRYSILLVVVATLLIGFHSRWAHRRASSKESSEQK
ncbi:MAG TPA: hypothetical protein VFQ39_00645 [Longimicrobium sp.]|nr:hypothetical protein [Longimicrobium sp.]